MLLRDMFLLRKPRQRKRWGLLVVMPVVRALSSTSGEVRHRLRLAYDGTQFRGWQAQPGARTVQGALEEALERRFGGRHIATVGASRTDAGVHASGQVAQADLPLGVDCDKLRYQLNRILPEDVRLLEVDVAPEPEAWQKEQGFGWHILWNSVGKRYSYRLRASRSPMDPTQRLYRAHISYPAIDFDVLEEALGLFVGKHDFRSFVNNAHNSDLAQKVTVRTMRTVELVRENDQGDATITFELDGALYKMLRNVVGTALAVAATPSNSKQGPHHGSTVKGLSTVYGHLTLDDIPLLLQGNRPRCDNPAKAAPAQGLFLDRVFFTGDDDSLGAAFPEKRDFRTSSSALEE